MIHYKVLNEQGKIINIFQNENDAINFINEYEKRFLKEGLTIDEEKIPELFNETKTMEGTPILA
jgi:hypothetical protein